MNTETHGLKRIFRFNKNKIYDGWAISVCQRRSVTNSSMLGWVLKKEIKTLCSLWLNIPVSGCVGSVVFIHFAF
jgi:hypothetical protein